MKQAMNKFYTKLSFHNRSLLLIDIVYNIIFVVLLVPLFSYAFEFVLDFTKQSYITMENLMSFLVSLPTILFVLLLIVVLPVFFLSKLSSLVFYCNTLGTLTKPYLPRIIYFGFMKTVKTIRRKNIGLLIFIIPFYIITNLPVIIGITFFADFEFISGRTTEFIFKCLFLFLIIVLCLIAFRGIFAVYYCILQKHSFREGLKHSKSLLKGRRRRTFTIMLIYNLLLLLAFFLLYYFVLLVTAIVVYLFSAKANVITVFLSAYPQISFYATLFISTITFILNVNLTFSLFHTYQEESKQLISLTFPDTQKSRHSHSKIQFQVVNALVFIIIGISLFHFYLVIHNDSLSLSDAFTGIKISSHRGNSDRSPENTIPALENAILANSDYAEIDVRQSKDGILVLMHDQSLERTAGLNQFVSDLTILELNKLDVGSWFGIEYIGTHIPTLEEALTYCKGRIKLNIEMKVNGDVESMAEQLAALIDQYDYDHQCIVSSTNYSFLLKLKELDEDIRTGYILSAVYGNFYEKKQIDFFSIRHNFINKNIVTKVHAAGKEVHAWTVNSIRELERMKSVGVDCIITDNPSLAAEVIYRDDTNDTFIQLLRKMMRNRSFYRLTQLLN